MPHELEYIVDQAVLLCDEGIKPDYFNGTHNANVKINGCKVCTAADKIPITNIPAFGICQKTQQPCVPVPLEWKDTYKVKVKGNQTLLYKSTLPCSLGGKIEFITSRQIPVSREDLDKLTEENAEDPPQEEEGLSWWDAVEMVPFAGGVVGMVRSRIKGDWVGFGLSAASLALDIGGLFSFGAGNAASAAVKTAKLAKAASKVGKAASKISKAALTAGGKLLTKASAKAAAKALAKKADDIAIRYGKVCVFACFPAGTPIHTQQGIKKIEQIHEGDRVWSQNPTSGEISLKKVTAIIRKQIDTTVQIELEGETIETTAEHPFYTKQGWKDAADLTEQDHIQTKNKKWYRVKGQNFLYTKKKVYNFEVEDWHTYFVGKLAWLVHNAKPCFSKLSKLLTSYSSKIFRAGDLKLLLDKKGLKHILQRHHPMYWDGSVKATQSFFSKNTTVKEIEKGINEVIKQNRSTIIQNGTRRGQYTGVVDGVKRTVGFKNGRIGQYY
ncbi:polymorphic toxin-type HINT domain-containing protein [Snodgrassella communis]|uniref:polymorphic toxin-type HINT domain-containing protein n=1 Tax=Snodgrassella communis TaxID=2946699 RepID=UPI00286ADE12|nr:polymorphic toxin-type HINT domain-containing protein [Snodgrassella communis]WMY92162.1 polymorphic toxin-type HINT domain-containing protein [Snodgrassella communis]